MLQQTYEKLAALPDMPDDKARQKAASILRGLLLLVMGLGVLVLGIWLLIKMTTTTGESPGVGILLLAGVCVLAGIYLVFASGHVVSGEAMVAAKESSSVLGKIVGTLLSAARGKT